MLTDILNPEITYDSTADLPWHEEKVTNIEKGLKRYYFGKNNFLSYQHGVWVTAHARKCLYEGMKIVGNDIVQVDTDSIKTINNYRDKFDALNKKIMEEAETFDVKPYAFKNGHKVYLGVWEHEMVKMKMVIHNGHIAILSL